MKQQASWAILLSAILLAACAGHSQPIQSSETSKRLLYILSNPEQMKRAKLVGQVVEYSRKGKPWTFVNTSFLLVTKQDEFSIGSEDGETVPYSDIGELRYAASKADEIENDRIKALVGGASIALPMLGHGQTAGSDASSNNIPDYFLGTYEDMVPKVIGGTVPETKVSVDCAISKGCVVRFGEGQFSGNTFDKVVPATTLKYAQAALSHAKEHRVVAKMSTWAWPAKNLQPLLTSAAAIDSCLNLGQAPLPEGYMLLCKLNQNPWDRPSVLLMGLWQSKNCTELFCGYEIFPLFRKNP